MIEYNTKRNNLIIREYGRNIQKLVEQCVSMENREERTRTAYAIVRIMSDVINSKENSNENNRNNDDFWNKLYSAGLQTRGTIDQNDTDYFIHQYTVDGKDYIWSRLGQYWVLWVAALVLLAFSIVAIVKTKTLIEKKK